LGPRVVGVGARKYSGIGGLFLLLGGDERLASVPAGGSVADFSISAVSIIREFALTAKAWPKGHYELTRWTGKSMLLLTV